MRTILSVSNEPSLSTLIQNFISSPKFNLTLQTSTLNQNLAKLEMSKIADELGNLDWTVTPGAQRPTMMQVRVVPMRKTVVFFFETEVFKRKIVKTKFEVESW